jgi:DNA polymerase bacteriophage-type
MVVSIDFETRSAVDLRKTGVYKYAADPSTDIWCMAYKAPWSDDVLVWHAGR